MTSQLRLSLAPLPRGVALAKVPGQLPVAFRLQVWVLPPMPKNRSCRFAPALRFYPACAGGSPLVRSTAAFTVQGAFATRKTATTPLRKRSRPARFSTAQALPYCILDTPVRCVLTGRGARPW